MEPLARLRIRTLFLLALTGGLAVTYPAAAQPARPRPAPPAPAPAPPPPAPAPPAPAIAMPAAAPDPIALALAPKPGGVTPEEAARIVSATKHSVRAKQEDLKAAASKVDQAFVHFFPQVSLSAGYTYLSPVSIDFSSAFPPALLKILPPGVKLTPLALPTNNFSLTASVALPVSDYALRIVQGYQSASHNEKSARYAAEAEALQAGADAKIAYFNWVRAKGSVVVTQEAIDQAKAHLEDAKKSFAVGLASKADVLRIDAQVAAAQQAHAEANAFASVAEEQLRILLGAKPDQPLEIGSDVMNEAATPPAETLQALQDYALVHRLESHAIVEAIESVRKAKQVTDAGYAPRVDAFADATYADPNQRIFPATNAWNATWDAGVKLSWTLNDTFTTIGASAEMKARVASLVEQRAALADGLRVEVASAYADAVKAVPAIEAADRGMVSAEESLRVRRELFRNGRATSSELVDAEAEMTQARLRRLDAHIGMLVARARLDHSTGHDVPVRPTSE